MTLGHNYLKSHWISRSQLLVLSYVNHSWYLWNHKRRWLWAQLLRHTPWPHTGCSTIKDGVCGLALCLPPRLCLSFSQFLFLRKASRIQMFSSCNKKIRVAIYLCVRFFMGIYSRSREEEDPSSTCQRACQLLLCFTLLLGHSLMCSSTSALTLWLDVTQFLFHAKQRRVSSSVSQCILARSKPCADEGSSCFFRLISSPYISPRLFTCVVHCAGWSIDPFPLTRQRWWDGSFSHLLPVVLGEEVSCLADLMGTNFL